MHAPPAPLSDGEYLNLWHSLQTREAHVCSRQCEYKQVLGNMFLCSTSGSAHVCDQNCNQRIYYDAHTDICRLSKRLFPREAEIDMARGCSGQLARKRSGEEEELSAPHAKRPLSADQMLALQQQAAWAQQQQCAQITAWRQ